MFCGFVKHPGALVLLLMGQQQRPQAVRGRDTQELALVAARVCVCAAVS